MSETKCKRCDGTGWVCARCGKSNRRPESTARRDFGKGCDCYRARSIQCGPLHVETTYCCAYCGARVALPYRWLNAEPDGASGYACASCRDSWRQWHSVAFERWQETRGETGSKEAGP